MSDAINERLSKLATISRETLELMDGYVKKSAFTRSRNIALQTKGFQSQQELEALYATSDISKKFVDYLVDEATRERIVFSDDNQNRQIWIDKFDLWEKDQ